MVNGTHRTEKYKFQLKFEVHIVSNTYVMSSVPKLIIVLMKLSLMMIPRMAFQSVVCSPSSRQMDSSANLTAGGGFPMARISTKCCFLMDFTADEQTNDWYDVQVGVRNKRIFMCRGLDEQMNVIV